MLITLIVTVIIRRFFAGVNPQRFLAPKIAQLNGSFINLSAFFTYENGDSHTFVDHGEGTEPASVAAWENAGSAKEDWLVRGARSRFARGVKGYLSPRFARDG